MAGPRSGWVEVASDVFQRRYHPLDVSVCAVRGERGLLVVDTRSSHREAREVVDDLRELDQRPPRFVVNTHAHYDHAFGNAVFAGAMIIGHELVPAHHAAYEVPLLDRWVREGREPVDEWREVVITPPQLLVSDRTTIDLGDRRVTLLHLGRGHTDNDLVLHVPESDAWLVGDLVEESGPPMYGSGSFPLDWPGTVGRLVELVGNSAVVVPGHGAPVDRDFVAAQLDDLAGVATLVRALHAAGVSLDDAVDAGGDRWPLPADGMASAVRDGYRALDDDAAAADV